MESTFTKTAGFMSTNLPNLAVFLEFLKQLFSEHCKMDLQLQIMKNLNWKQDKICYA